MTVINTRDPRPSQSYIFTKSHMTEYIANDLHKLLNNDEQIRNEVNKLLNRSQTNKPQLTLFINERSDIITNEGL